MTIPCPAIWPIAVSFFSTVGLPVTCALQIIRHQRHLEQSLEYGKPIGGAAKDNTVGWSMPNAEGYNAADNVVCAAGLTQCHYKPACYDLQTSAERCGSCDISCDFLTQVPTCSCSSMTGLVMSHIMIST